MSASSRLDLDNELNRNDETRNNEVFEDGDFPALKPNYDRREHAHHMHFCTTSGRFAKTKTFDVVLVLSGEAKSVLFLNGT